MCIHFQHIYIHPQYISGTLYRPGAFRSPELADQTDKLDRKDQGPLILIKSRLGNVLICCPMDYVHFILWGFFLILSGNNGCT